ncbi:hypothetical protein [Alienimonas californiensis]|uniref:DUF4375 domain-containing protein n=1 Tax=Alienimonas californiensis TaxID=2527989 RepID=A0A517P766_9PLAN|nr:hypothetical protein [Alienimonas californiensis]QDT15203.1 hypothetical protein CA12_12840 [Alienimonas californiensis]
MPVRYAAALIEHWIADRDFDALYDVVRGLPEPPGPLAFFLDYWLWAPRVRGGAWQYYDGIDEQAFARVATLMDRYAPAEVAARYRAGMREWDSSGGVDGPDDWMELDRWMERHTILLEDVALDLITSCRDALAPPPARPGGGPS